MGENYFPYDVVDSVAVLKMNRLPVNGLDFEFLKGMSEISAELNARDDIRAILWTSNLKVFGGGMDLAMAAKMDKFTWNNYCIRLHKSFMDFENILKPVVGVINGAAVAGGALVAISCDFRIMGESRAYFSLPEVDLGICLLVSATTRLPRILGRAKAIDWLFTGRRINAKEAMEMGLANMVFKDEELMEKSFEFAQSMAAKGRHVIAAAKKALNYSLHRDILANYYYEHEAVEMCADTEEMKEGYASFFAKRKPDFKKLMK
jgi:enoyl-CoA hydratase/carnithine racemase